MVPIKIIHPRANEDHVGILPQLLSEHDPMTATQQFNKNYAHGGGWTPQKGFTLQDVTNVLRYPGDPPLFPLVEMHLRDELILVYEYAVVAVIQPDRSFEVCRMD